MEQWTEVRRRVLTGELSKRAACREYEMSWQTLAKMLTHTEPPGYRMQQPRKKRKLDPFLPIIHEILQADKLAPKKQRHTATRIFQRLCEEHGYEGAYTSVRNAVRQWKQQTQEVFLPLSHPPGEAQVDFGHAYVDLAGEREQLALFVMSLPYSDALYIQGFPRECTESFQEGHKRAIEFFEGVPTRISYDNSRVAVAKITGSRDREPTREFLRLQSHYLYESHFCLVRRANEKGHVENLVGYGRRNFLVPVPRVGSLTELNAELERLCRADLERTLRGKSASKRELLAEERTAMLDLPRQSFDARRVTQANANSLSLVQFDTNSYSVPVKYAHREITVVASVDEVHLVFQGELIARHARHWGREQYLFDPVHYLALLEKKPGGFDHARPLKDWELPECFTTLRRRMETEPTGLGTREYIRTLRLLESCSLQELTGAVDYALDIGIHDADSIRVILEHRRESPVGLFSLDGRPHLRAVTVTETYVSAYQALLAEDVR
ncbi:IS21 family transposase [Bythopirellula goksoeyrii]|uniref:Integrase core domain protein n=1 Tax=Bythopirellula goksoeyrii TaxID=1400387 RepID=A0A5B9QAV8_9BACT|nr:IS21 family transposase [Bythopirellula goksoeyrii]QEG36184.1 Integrase core domain protein [Bythopirellula goksoeyrii]